MIIRIQDNEGRGPWRPGFSHKWVSNVGPNLPPPIFIELQNFSKICMKAHKAGKHIGCAVLKEKVDLWFQPDELKKLFSMGFNFVDCSKCEVLAETKTQIVIASNIPLRHLSKISL